MEYLDLVLTTIWEKYENISFISKAKVRPLIQIFAKNGELTRKMSKNIDYYENYKN